MIRRMAEPVRIADPVMLFRISQLFRPGMSDVALYEATRGVWRVGPRRERARYGFAVANDVVQEVFEIHHWQPAGISPYQTRAAKDVKVPGRWEFIGARAPESVRSRYIGRSVGSYFRRGTQNPVMYVEIP
jgi:hypothetical protein